MIRARKLLCPCCKGDKYLEVMEYDDESDRGSVRKYSCTHCIDGYVDGEVEEPLTIENVPAQWWRNWIVRFRAISS